jgi:signal peptidase I
MPVMPPPSPDALPQDVQSISEANTVPDGAVSMAELRREAVDILKFMAKFAALVLIIRCLLISSFNIPSESMQPRLLIGDYLIVNKSAYGYSRYSLPFDLPLPNGRIFARTPERGDVVVFKAPPTQRDDYIKRVIGLPGDRIQVVDGVVLINGTAIARRRIADAIIPVGENMVEASYGNPCFRAAEYEVQNQSGAAECHYPRYIETLPNGRSYAVLDLMMGEADTTGVYQVPEGHLFLMGDNRDRSYDSRFPAVEGAGIGIVPQDNLVGEALVTIFSTDGSAVWYNPLSWFSAARWNRIGEGF